MGLNCMSMGHEDTLYTGYEGSVQLVYKLLVLICMTDLLWEKNIIPWLISLSEQARDTKGARVYDNIRSNE